MKKIDINNYNVREIENTELITVNGGSIFEDIGFAMGVLLYEDIKLSTENPMYTAMVNSYSH